MNIFPEVNSRDSMFAFLVKHNGFRQIGPRSIIFENNRDKIHAWIDESTIIITSDGENVVGDYKILKINDTDKEVYWNCILQEILALF